MIISKLDITVYFHITPVHLYLIPRGFSYLIGRKSTPKTYICAFCEKKNVLPGDFVKLHQGAETGVLRSFIGISAWQKWVHFLH